RRVRGPRPRADRGDPGRSRLADHLRGRGRRGLRQDVRSSSERPRAICCPTTAASSAGAFPGRERGLGYSSPGFVPTDQGDTGGYRRMRNMRARAFTIALLVVAFTCLFLPVANAYVDPGSGSFIFQALIGGLLAVAVAFRVFWRRVLGVFGKSRRESP